MPLDRTPLHISAPPLAPQTSPAMVLDCGSVIHHGPQWNPNGGDCEGRLVGRMSAADGIGALGVFSVLLTVASLADSAGRRNTAMSMPSLTVVL